MPIFNVRTPDGSLMKISGPEDATDEELIAIAEANYKPPPTFFQRAKTALSRGVEQTPESISGITLGAQKGLGFEEAATKKLAEIKAKQAKPQEGAPPITFEELEQTYGKEGAIEALKKLPTFAAEQILQSAPSMAVPIAAGMAATPFTGPVGGLLTGIGTYGLQQYGQFMQRQAEQAKSIEELEPGKAAVAAAVTAPLGFFVDRLTLGMSKVPTKVLGQEVMSELAKRAGARAATGATIGVIAEAPTEVLEQVAERWQANLPLLNEDAIREYKEAAAGAAVVGGVAGGTSSLISSPGQPVPTTPAAPPIEETTSVPPVAMPEATAIPPETITPTPTGMSLDEFQAQAERRRLEEEVLEQERSRLAEEERQQAMAATQKRMAGLPGFTGMPREKKQEDIGAPEDLMGEVRRRQEEEAAAEQKRQQAEAQRQRDEQLAQEDELRTQIDKIQKTTFSADPVQNQIAKERALGQLRSELGSMTAARIRAEQAEPPKYEPITAPQDVPKGAKVTKFTPEEEAEIEGLKSNLSEVNKEIAKAKKEKTSLFNRLKGELIYRPGAFGIKDIDSDNKALGALFNKKGQGVLLEDLVADGSLDEFLPARNRALIGGVQNPNFDAGAAVEHIADKLRTRQYGSTAESELLGRLTEEKDRIQQEIDRLQTVPEVNLDLARRAAVPKAEEEQISLPDLEADAQMKGVDTEALKQRVATANPDATPEQFLGFYRGALGAATSTSPSYDIGGYEYTAEELETSIAERLTDEEIDEYIAQAEAEQATTARVAKKPAPRGKAEPAPKREAEEEPVTPEPEEVKIPGAGQSPALSRAVSNNDWNQVTNELEKSKNPVIANVGRMAKGLKGVSTEINPVLIKSVASRRAVAIWSRDSNSIYFKSAQYAGSEHAVAHEVTHALTYFAVNNPRPDQKAAVKRLDNLYRFVKTKLKAEGKGKLYGLTDMDEFLAEANGNPDFQKELARIPYQKQTAWGAFTQAVADILGIKNSSALSEVLALTEELTTTPASSKTVAKGAKKIVPVEGKVSPDTPAFKKWFGDSKVVDENGEPLVVYHGTNADIEKFKTNRPAWFAVDPVLANLFSAGSRINAGMKPRKGSAVYPVYLSIKNPLDLTQFLPRSEISMVDLFKKIGAPTDNETLAGIARASIYSNQIMLPPWIENPVDYLVQGMHKPSVLYELLDNPVVVQIMKNFGYDGVKMREFVSDRKKKNPTESESITYAVFDGEQIKSAIGNRGTYSPTEASIIALELSPTARDALEILEGQGRTVKAPEPGYIEKRRQEWNNAVQNPKLTKEQSISAFRKWADQFETWAFSSDAGLNNQIRKAVMDSMIGQEEKIGILLNSSLSQTVHSDAVANLFLTKGDIKWDEDLKKWVGVDSDNNILNLSKQMDVIAEKHGMTKEQIELIAHTAFEAKRTQSLIRENANIVARAEAMRAEAKRIRADSPVAASELLEKANREEKKQKVIHMTPEQIQAGMTQFELFPELNDGVKTWDGIRENALKVMVDTGLYSQEEAENLLANADYVPFFREDQIEQGKGPKEFLRSLSVQADKRMKGSMKPVNDIFDNMVRWTQYAVNRGVRNRSALALVDTAGAVGLGEKVADPKDGENVVRVWRNGQEEYHSMADPMFVSAFRGLESVSIPTIKFFSKFADVLRNSVVLFPLFSVSQVTQDSFAAMFSSGLKPQHALSIPFRAVKEFIQTLRGKSSAHEELKNVGAVGVRDFTSSIIRSDVEVMAGLKKDKNLWEKVKRGLGTWAMAADNAVRQATYEAAIAQGMSRSEAIEKAFEIFNVRRRGSSQMLAMAGQVIPFFNAYLAAQNVAYRTLTGVGTSPTERKAALQTLAATTASVMALSMLYAMMMGDDEGYEKKPTPTRDRLLIIPGTNGNGIPLRSDLFLLPKALAEHTYHLLTENGMTDPAKFRASMAAMLANSFLSPTVVPQAVKPLVEAAINFDFFQQQPLVGIYQGKKAIDRQFTNSTSEFAKALAQVPIRYNFEKAEWQGIASPIAIDHIVRGMFGSFGGLFLEMTNPIIAAAAGTTRPAMSIRDAFNAIPNASAFISKEYEVGLRKDFYALKDVTDRAANTLSDYKQRNPEEIKAFLEDPKNKIRVGMAPMVNSIAQKLTEIRKNVDLITNIEDPKYTADRKEEMIKKFREQEYQLLKNIDLRKLREMAQM